MAISLKTELDQKCDLGAPPLLAADVAGRDGVRGPMALLSCVAMAEVWAFSGRIDVVPLCRSLTKSLKLNFPKCPD